MAVYMLLNKQEILARKLITDSAPNRFRNASYDLEIGRIIDVDGHILKEAVLEPQGMVRVISREKVKLPGDISGCAHVKTSLTDQGILATNIGIVDPDYKGFLSSTLINVGKTRHSLAVGDVFLRLVFHGVKMPQDFKEEPAASDEVYVMEKKRLALTSFSKTFLNIEETAKTAAREVVGTWKAKVLIWASVFALIITAGAVLLTALNLDFTYGSLMRAEDHRIEAGSSEEQTKKYNEMDARIRELEKQTLALKAQIATMNSAHPDGSK
jgi:dUTPase